MNALLISGIVLIIIIIIFYKRRDHKKKDYKEARPRKTYVNGVEVDPFSGPVFPPPVPDTSGPRGDIPIPIGRYPASHYPGLDLIPFPTLNRDVMTVYVNSDTQVPIYPTIDNDKCGGDSTSSYNEDVDNPSGYLSNIEGVRTYVSPTDVRDTYLVYDDPVNCTSSSDEESVNCPTCYKPIPNCGNGRFKQDCLNDDYVKQSCDSTGNMSRRLDDGSCHCYGGYTGSECQFSLLKN
jgi:hypothetical protein